MAINSGKLSVFFYFFTAFANENSDGRMTRREESCTCNVYASGDYLKK